jgi:hypothetical protein
LLAACCVQPEITVNDLRVFGPSGSSCVCDGERPSDGDPNGEAEGGGHVRIVIARQIAAF